MSGPEYDDPIAHPGGTSNLVNGGRCYVCGGTMKLKDGYQYCERCMAVQKVTTPPPVCEVCGSHINPDYQRGPICGACLKEREDAVLSPSHYTAGGIETIDFIRAKLTPDEFRGFLKGSIIKYLSRANLKGSEEQDYGKTSFYSRMLAGDDPRKEAEA